MSDQHPVEYTEGPHALETQQSGAGFGAFGSRGDPDPEENSGGGLERYVAAVFRFKWLILLVTCAGAAAGVLVVRTLPTQYEAQAMLWIESPRQQSAAQPIRSGELFNAYAWVELVKSFSVLDPVVWKQRLYLNVQTPEEAEATSTLVAV